MGSKKGNQAFSWNGVEEKLSGVYLEWDRIKVVRRLPGMGSNKGCQAFTCKWDRRKVIRRLAGMGSKKSYQAFIWNGIE